MAETRSERTGFERRVARNALVIGLSVVLVVVSLAFAGVFDVAELGTVDARFRLRGPLPAPAEIVIVAIDEDSMIDLDERWPWPREVHARLVERLNEAGVRTIGFDVFFGQTSNLPGDDERLAQALAQAGGNVILVNRVESVTEAGYRMVAVRNPNDTLQAARPILGLANKPFDADGFIRRSLVAGEWAGQMRLSFPAAVLAHYLGVDPERAIVDTEGRVGRIGDVEIPLLSSPQGNLFVINFLGPPRTVRTVSYYQVLDRLIPDEWLHDKIVLVGATDETLHDTFHTPFSMGRPMPGVELHAHAIATALTGRYVRPVGAAAALVLVAFAGLSTAYMLSRLSAWRGLLGALLLGAGYVVAVFWLFSAREVLAPLVGPLVAITCVYISTTGYRFVVEERERRRVRGIFGRYVSDDILKELVDTGHEVALGGKRQRVTMLFSDIRGFTPMTEMLQPEEVVALLNEYFEEMTDIIFEHGGCVDKFMGDCIMALFGAPVPREDAAVQCVRAAVRMRQALTRLKARWESEGKGSSFDSGIGINTDEVVAGNIGSSRRMEYTVIGDGVNLAARLESATKEHDAPILISENTYHEVKAHVVAEFIGAIEVKGKAKAVPVYRVTGLTEDMERTGAQPA